MSISRIALFFNIHKQKCVFATYVALAIANKLIFLLDYLELNKLSFKFN